jgi:hypothetical protein
MVGPKSGYIILAINLFGRKVATTHDDTKRRISRVGRARTLELNQKWLKSKEIVNGKLTTVVWGFSGGWAFSADAVEPVPRHGCLLRPSKSSNQ